MLSLNEHPKDGTGLIIDNGNSEQLKHAIVSLLATNQINEKIQRNGTIDKNEKQRLLDLITYPAIRREVEMDPRYGDHIKAMCYERIEKVFRWSKVSEKLAQIYLSLDY